MRKKIKEIMSKEEGFTLVELLAVIVILGIIVAIAVPGIGKVIENSRAKADDAEIELIEDAARIYYTGEEEPINEVPVSDLIEKGYLDIKKGETPPPGNVVRTVGDDGKVTIEYKSGVVEPG